MTANDHATYYTDMSPKLLRGFEKMLACAVRPIEDVLGKTNMENIRQDARAHFKALIPQLPYIGGNKVPGTKSLIGGAQILAIIRALENQGLPKERIGEIIYFTLELFFACTPALLAKIMGWLMGSGLFLEKRKKIARESQKREYPEAFVSVLVDSKDGSFDFGQDIFECAICKLYKKHEAEEYLPYICLGDYPMFRRLGIGFSRTKTLGHGDDRCDFRFKRKGGTSSGWPPEELPEWK